ncbi:MAG TPA: hypothetical protein VMS40_05730 [Vicinamibacterales bacterium]|nr:hypothetical protein [Vicinamibacterales bacterium]
MAVAIATRTRGTIIKVPDATPGLLMIDGQQLAFVLEGRWKSAVAPAANMVVEVDLSEAGVVAAVTVVDSQQLAKEKIDQLSGLAQQHGKEAAAIAKQGVGALAARMGTPTLVAAVAVWIAWFFLPVASIDFLFVSRSFTFWQILGLNAANLSDPSGSSHGLFALIGVLAIAMPFAVPFISHARAKLLNAAPLAYLVLAVLGLLWRINRASSGAGGNSEIARGMAREMASAAWDAISIGSGTYLLIAATGFLAYQAYKAR